MSISCEEVAFRRVWDLYMGLGRHLGPVYEGFHTLLVAVSETGDESTRELEISMEDRDSNVVLLESFTRD